MTFALDPQNVWERQWGAKNPEPHIDGPLSLEQVAERIAWHARLWKAFKSAFLGGLVP